MPLNPDNNATLGFSIQKLICDRYRIIPNSQVARSNFESSYDVSFRDELEHIIDEIFKKIPFAPVECTTSDKDSDGTYNFILENESTLSIRTNLKGDKIAPREVGQAGFEKLNYHFARYYGAPINTQRDIQRMIYQNIHKVLPIFFENLFDADYIVWVHREGESFKMEVIEGNCNVGIDYDRGNFSFTRNLDEWTESTTLKYKGTSIAEVQVHKYRSFKFRFIMKNVIPFFKETKITNETLGVSAEIAICGIFNLDFPNNMIERGSFKLRERVEPAARAAFKKMPPAIEYTGNRKGSRGGQSKCSYDYVLEGNKTLSLKTNIDRMVCPPDVGQPAADTCYLYFKDFIDGNHVDKHNFKKMVFDHIEELLPIYLSHLFDSDYLLRIYESPPGSGVFATTIIEKGFGLDFKWDRDKIDFSKKTIDEWNESNTVYYDGMSLGEFQVHNHRDCYKFRFNFNNLIKIIDGCRE